MAINKPDSSINFRFGTLAGYKQATKSPEDIYFVYTPADAVTADQAYGVIYVNGIQFGSNVADLAVGGEGVDSSIVFKHLKSDGTMEDVKMAMISVEEHQHYETIVQQIGNLDASLLKNINVNGVEGDVEDNIASVTIDGDKILVGGNGAYKDSSIDAAIAVIDASLRQAISAAGVTSFGGATGAITVRGGQSTDGAVNLVMSGNELQASIEGLGTAAFEASTAFANAQETTNKFTEVDASIDRLDASVSALESDVADLKTEDSSLESAITALKTEDSSLENAITALKSKDEELDTSIDRLDASVSALENTLDGLDVSVAPESGKYVAGFEQENGLIKNVTKVALPSGTFTINASGNEAAVFTDNAGTSASVDIVGGNNITVSNSGGTITIAADAATTPNDGSLNFKVGNTTAASFGANQAANTDIAFASGNDYATVAAGTGTITVTVGGTNAVTENSSALVESGAVYTAVENAKTASNVSIGEAGTPTTGFLKTYILYQNGTNKGEINIPKDLVVTSGSIVTGTWNGNTFTPDDPQPGSGPDKALKLTIANQDDPVYINVADLVDVYTAGDGIAISATNEVSAKVHEANGLSINNDGSIAMATVVASEAGVGGSNGAMTAAQAEKLAGIETGAQVNDIESISVNGQTATIGSNKDATVTIDATQITMGGGDSSTVAQKIAEAISAAGVTSFGGATGAISLDGNTTSTKGHVVFTMNSSTLQATVENVAPADVVTSIAEASANDSSNGVSVKVITEAGSVTGVEVGAPDFANTYVTKTAFDASVANIDASIDRLDSSVSALETKAGNIDNYTVNGQKISDNPVLDGADVSLSSSYSPVTGGTVAANNTVESAIHALDASNANQETRLTAVENQLMWHTLDND